MILKLALVAVAHRMIVPTVGQRPQVLRARIAHRPTALAAVVPPLDRVKWREAKSTAGGIVLARWRAGLGGHLGSMRQLALAADAHALRHVPTAE